MIEIYIIDAFSDNYIYLIRNESKNLTSVIDPGGTMIYVLDVSSELCRRPQVHQAVCEFHARKLPHESVTPH